MKRRMAIRVVSFVRSTCAVETLAGAGERIDESYPECDVFVEDVTNEKSFI